MNIENSFFYHYIIIISNSTHHCQPHPISWRAIRKVIYKTQCTNIRCTYVPLHTWCQNSFLLTINWKININNHIFSGNCDISAILCAGQGALACIDTRVKNEIIGWNEMVLWLMCAKCRGIQAHIIILS